ncbi:hypothetical protein LUZ61_004777 [Rhynchospora tenuis]|uniref:Glycosyltransferase n=1 Tax=Rhynchospora tenuis TaxID=198213 RepID=A0AAD5ZNC6_9POAL|nr:hypothetical protein LUZ61_004777 [Rhynchospora tenuis]
MSSPPHALVLPWPLQSHIIPLMHLSHFLADNGFKITFVNTEDNHDRIVSAGAHADRFRMISIPNGLGPEEQQFDTRMIDAIEYNMPSQLENLIRKINEEGMDKITVLIAETGMGWAMGVAERLKLRSVAFCPTSATFLATWLNIPKLRETGVIDENGSPKIKEIFKLAPTMKPIDETYFAWNFVQNIEIRQRMFRHFENNVQYILKAPFILCNSFQDFELPIFTNFPNIIPLGPLPLGKSSNPAGHLWSDDPTSIDWLDQQSVNSVVYVAFGSIATLDQNQVEEFAFALDSSKMHFLWVIRSDQTMGEHHDFLKQFQESINRRGKGKIVNWCNQEKVLAHPSIACFVSHCGWNSTMDGVKNGMPFLCLPYLADQFAVRDYLCDVVNVGLSLVRNENGVVTREEIKSKLIELLQSEEIKLRARRIKELAERSISPGGSSFQNLYNLVENLKKTIWMMFTIYNYFENQEPKDPDNFMAFLKHYLFPTVVLRPLRPPPPPWSPPTSSVVWPLGGLETLLFTCA